MSNKLQTLVQHAKNTFLKQSATDTLDFGKFDLLVSLANDIRIGDVNLPARLCSRNGGNPAKVDYLSIHEDENFTMGVFIIAEDASIPIHDHPGMHGILKVLHGELEITTYSVVRANPTLTRGRSRFYYKTPLEAVKNQAVLVKSSDPCSQLAPNVNNIHLVRCTNGPAAFLDILGPPYDDTEDPAAARSCHYFREFTDEADKTTLVQISTNEAWP